MARMPSTTSRWLTGSGSRAICGLMSRTTGTYCRSRRKAGEGVSSTSARTERGCVRPHSRAMRPPRLLPTSTAPRLPVTDWKASTQAANQAGLYGPGGAAVAPKPGRSGASTRWSLDRSASRGSMEALVAPSPCSSSTGGASGDPDSR